MLYFSPLFFKKLLGYALAAAFEKKIKNKTIVYSVYKKQKKNKAASKGKWGGQAQGQRQGRKHKK